MSRLTYGVYVLYWLFWTVFPFLLRPSGREYSLMMLARGRKLTEYRLTVCTLMKTFGDFFITWCQNN